MINLKLEISMRPLSTCDFSTLYTTLPHNIITDKFVDLIERIFQREDSPCLACNDNYAVFFFTSENMFLKGYPLEAKTASKN